MTLDQAIAFGLLIVTVGFFVWGRLPYDLVAVLSLITGVLTGIVPARKAFEGFSDDIIFIIAAALVISTAIARSGVVETLLHPLLRYLKTEQTQVPALAAAVAFLSVFSKNVGALAIFMPVAFQLTRRTGTNPSALLMPMSFASLMGGLVTLVGTSPNIIVSQVRQDMYGQPFGMFSFTPVGLAITVIGVLFLSFGYRLVPKGRRPAATIDSAFTLEGYTTEARVDADSALAGQTTAALNRLSDGQVELVTIIRERFRRVFPSEDTPIRPGDVLVLRGDPENLERLVARGRLKLAGEQAGELARAAEHDSVVEGVIMAPSSLVGRTLGQSEMRQRFGLTLLALSREAQQFLQRLSTIRFRAGDVVVLKGTRGQLPDALGQLHILPLAERNMPLGYSHRSILPALILLVAMIFVATRLLPISITFMIAASAMVLLRFLTMSEAYEAIDWPLLVLIGALIPVGHAVKSTGGTELIAGALAHIVQHLPSYAALAIVLLLAMVVTPFLHNAPTVLMLAPVAASMAQQLNLNADAFLMAVALGAGCDFLTPIGHQCNTLVYGPGGYRFGDYWRLGAPLSLLVVVLGVPLISLVWNVHP